MKILDGKLVSKKIINSLKESAILEKCLNNKSNNACIMIDKRIFYKIKNDPKDY